MAIARCWDASIPGVIFLREETVETAGMKTSIHQRAKAHGVYQTGWFILTNSEIHSPKIALARDSELT
ncbi:MAG: hypothetical protein ABJO97_03750 [Roseibium sp.]|uniref:hypothetical protein n=1 Tax=Roseibium sp. TaxID=1936156 RepID=UPI0032997D78